MTEHFDPEAESILDINFDDVYDFETLPADTEAQLRVLRAEIHTSQRSGNKMIHFVFDVPDNPRIDDIHHYAGLPGEDDDAKMRNKKLQRVKEAYIALGVTPGRVEMSDFVGQTCWAIVGEETDAQYGTRNTIKSFVLPR